MKCVHPIHLCANYPEHTFLKRKQVYLILNSVFRLVGHCDGYYLTSDPCPLCTE